MCNCPAHFGLVDCTCRCDHTADRMLQWRARADALAATVQRVRDLCDDPWTATHRGELARYQEGVTRRGAVRHGEFVNVDDLRAALAPSDPATDTGGEGP